MRLKGEEDAFAEHVRVNRGGGESGGAATGESHPYVEQQQQAATTHSHSG